MRFPHLIALSLIWCGALAAQETAQLGGLVMDASRAAVPEARITVVSEDTGFRRVVDSDSAGTYEAAYLLPGTYKVTVRKDGFRTLVQFGLDLHAAQFARVDFRLQIGDVRETVTVNGSAVWLHGEEDPPGTLVDRSWIDQAPLNGRGILSLLEFAPGTVITPASGGEAGQFSVNGQRPNTNYFTVDGAGANTGVNGGGLPAQISGGSLPAMTAFGSLNSLASVEALDEFRLQTSTTGAASGRSSGGQVELSTRAGSNEFHGLLFGAFRNEALAANDWFANSQGQPRLPLRFADFGGTLGGPVRRNRTFFFVSYEGLRLRQPYTWQTTVPSLATRANAPLLVQPLLNAYPVPNGPDLGGGIAQWTGRTAQPSGFDGGSLRADHALSTRLLLFGRFSQSPSSTEFGYSPIDSVRIQSQTITIGLNAALTPSVTGEFRFNTSGTRGDSIWLDGSGQNIGGCLLDPPLIGSDACIGFSRFAVGGLDQLVTGANASNSARQWNLVDAIEVRRGAHDLRAGVDWRTLLLNRTGPDTHVSVTAADIASVLNGNLSIAISQTLQHSTTISEASVFAEDTWRMNPRLTLIYGLRWELDPPPRAPVPPPNVLPSQISVQPEVPIWQARYNMLAPRIGLAYALTADQRTILRIGGGLYFDPDFGAATDGINGGPFNTWQYNGGPYPSATVAPTTAITYGFSPNLRIPSTWEWNATLERTLTQHDTLSLAYVGASGRNLLRREVGPGSSEPIELVLATSDGWSTYHALQAQYRRKLSRGVQALISYNWSHSIDNGSSDSAVYFAPVGATWHDVGSSDFDVRHSLNAAVSYDWRGWSANAIVSARTGFPINVLDNETALGLSFADIFAPDRVAGQPVWLNDPSAPGGRRLNPAAFLALSSLQGDLGRNAITGFGAAQLDAAVRRTFRIKERASFEVRVEAFNALNHPDFADPLRFLVSPLFGRAPSMLNLMLGSGSPSSGLAPAFQMGGPRAIQLVARFRF